MKKTGDIIVSTDGTVVSIVLKGYDYNLSKIRIISSNRLWSTINGLTLWQDFLLNEGKLIVNGGEL